MRLFLAICIAFGTLSQVSFLSYSHSVMPPYEVAPNYSNHLQARPIKDRFERVLGVVENITLPSVYPFGFRAPHSQSLQDFQDQLTQTSYRIIDQFADKDLQQALWRMIFGPSGKETISKNLFLAEALGVPLIFGFWDSSRPMAKAFYLRALPALEALPTWHKVFRLLAAVELVHQYEHIAAISSRRFGSSYSYEAEYLAVVNAVYTALASEIILSSAPYEALKKETRSADANSINPHLLFELEEMLTVSRQADDEYLIRQLYFPVKHRGVTAEQAQQLVQSVLQNMSITHHSPASWEKIHNRWLQHHKQEMKSGNTDDYGSIGFASLTTLKATDPIAAQAMQRLIAEKTPGAHCKLAFLRQKKIF